MKNSKPTTLDWECLDLSGADADLARIIAEETELERRVRKSLARVAAATAAGFAVDFSGIRKLSAQELTELQELQSEFTADEVEALSWDELLVFDGECFIRCCQRAKLPSAAVLDFVEVQCAPANRLAVRWFSMFVRMLEEKVHDDTEAFAQLRAKMKEEAVATGSRGGQAKAARLRPLIEACRADWRTWLAQGEPENKAEFARSERPALRRRFPPEDGFPEIADDRTIIRWLRDAAG